MSKSKFLTQRESADNRKTSEGRKRSLVRVCVRGSEGKVSLLVHRDQEYLPASVTLAIQGFYRSRSQQVVRVPSASGFPLRLGLALDTIIGEVTSIG